MRASKRVRWAESVEERTAACEVWRWTGTCSAAGGEDCELNEPLWSSFSRGMIWSNLCCKKEVFEQVSPLILMQGILRCTLGNSQLTSHLQLWFTFLGFRLFIYKILFLTIFMSQDYKNQVFPWEYCTNISLKKIELFICIYSCLDSQTETTDWEVIQILATGLEKSYAAEHPLVTNLFFFFPVFIVSGFPFCVCVCLRQMATLQHDVRRKSVWKGKKEGK